jgi:phosphoribosylglycinamide formyltransferase-1
MNRTIRIAALISGSGSNLEAILTACESGTVDGRVVCVGSDNPEAKGLLHAVRRKISTFVVDYGGIIRRYRENPGNVPLPGDYDEKDILARQALFPEAAGGKRASAYFAARAAAEAQILEKMPPDSFDLLVLAGFMRNLTPYFIDRVNTDSLGLRIMNIHPALLPSFPGTDGYGDTFRYGCKVGGCTVHFIDYGEDTGPIIGQRAFEFAETDTVESIKEKGLRLEWQLYPECIALFAQNRLLPVKMTYRKKNGEVWQRTVVRIASP